MNSLKIFEEEQRNLFLSSIKNDNDRLYCEVPVFCRSVDLVIHDTLRNTITAIEFKLSNWKKAVKQALSVAISFDYVEICVPLPRTDKGKSSILEYCDSLGIGVYFFNVDSYEFLHMLLPQKVVMIWEYQRISVINYLLEEMHYG
jgi:hypothetical protein